MATARAIANGNWSSTSTWNGGVLPGNGDTVYANGFNVTINQDILIGGANNPTVNAGSFVSGQWYEVLFVGTTSWTGIGAASNTAGTIFLATGVGTGTGNARALATLSTASNTAAGATGGGGSFAMSAPFAITTDLRAGTTTCLSVTGATALTLDGLRVVGGTGTNANAINYSSSSGSSAINSFFTGGGVNGGNALNNTSSSTFSISSSTITGGSNNFSAIQNASSGTIAISSSTLTAGGGSTGNGVTNSSSNGSVTITGSTLTGATGSSTSQAASNSLTGTMNISGSTLTASNGAAVSNLSTGTLIITTSDFSASAFANAVSATNSGAAVRLSGNFLDHWSGFRAVNSPRFHLGAAPTLGQTRFALAGTTDSYFTMFGSDFGTFGNPIAANVRSGVSYGGGNLTGTCAVPAAGSVSLGVPVDAGFGTAVLTPEAVWGHASRTITEGGITAADVWSAATRTITGGTVDTLTNAPTVPTAAAIATQVRTELATELARVDAAVSTRLATSGYTAPSTAPTAAANASAVRTELATELARVDVATSTRLASSAYTAPSNSDVTAIKAKTDLLETTRLAQCSTVATTGAQLAAALS